MNLDLQFTNPNILGRDKDDQVEIGGHRMRRYIILVACFWLATGSLWGKIVFHSDRDGNTEIYTMSSDGTNQKRLTFNDVGGAHPAWSPNGRQIAFHSYHDETGGIYVMDVDGNNQRRLTHSFYDESPSWSPDGNQIAFQRYREDDQSHVYNIFVMEADGSNVRQVTDFWGAGRPKWSPDGEWILFKGSELHPIRPDGTETGDVFAIRPDGTDLWQVTETKPDTWRLLGGWSPDGKQILYKEVVNDPAIAPTPVIATLHPSKPQRVFKRVPVKMPPMRFYTPCFSADGKSILFSGKRDGRRNIYRFGLVDKQLIQLTDSPGDDAAPQEWDPRLPVSPRELTLTRWGEIKATQ